MIPTEWANSISPLVEGDQCLWARRPLTMQTRVVWLKKLSGFTVDAVKAALETHYEEQQIEGTGNRIPEPHLGRVMQLCWQGAGGKANSGRAKKLARWLSWNNLRKAQWESSYCARQLRRDDLAKEERSEIEDKLQMYNAAVRRWTPESEVERRAQVMRDIEYAEEWGEPVPAMYERTCIDCNEAGHDSLCPKCRERRCNEAGKCSLCGKPIPVGRNSCGKCTGSTVGDLVQQLDGMIRKQDRVPASVRREQHCTPRLLESEATP